MLEKPSYIIPTDFYDAQGWNESIVGFYSGQSNNLTQDSLEKPVEHLTSAVSNVILSYNALSSVVLYSLGKSINPLYIPNEYNEFFYDIFMLIFKV